MKLARVFSAGAGCSSAFYLALAALIFASVPYGRSQAPTRVTTSRPWPEVLGMHLGMCPREAYSVFQTSHPRDKVTIHPYALTTIPQPVINGLSITSPPAGASVCAADIPARSPDGKRRLRFSPNSPTAATTGN